MKQIFNILFFIPVLLHAQAPKDSVKFTVDNATQKITYTEVVLMPNTSKDIATNTNNKTREDLYRSIKSWFSKGYGDTKIFIKMDDKELGKIVAVLTSKLEIQFRSYDRYSKSFRNSLKPTPYELMFTISVFAKDNRYKYEITDIISSIDKENTNLEAIALKYDEEPTRKTMIERAKNFGGDAEDKKSEVKVAVENYQTKYLQTRKQADRIIKSIIADLKREVAKNDF